MSKFILDTNILISAYRIKYPMDIMPSFWDNLLTEAEKGTFLLIDWVVEEINKGEDELKDWLNDNIDKIQVLNSNNEEVINSYRDIIQHVVDNPQYKERAKEDFSEVADSWIIAHALAHGYTIVTEEVYDRNIKKKIPIPNICRDFNISYITTIDFLRFLNIKI